MDPEDPEKRIADLERQLGEQQRGADPLPVAPDRPEAGSTSDADPAGRRFKVSVMPKTWQRFATYGFLFLALAGFAKYFNTNHGGMAGHLVMLLGFAVVWGLVLQWLFAWRKVVIRVTTDGMTISKWPDDVFSFRDAELGQWRKTRLGLYAGRALFLTSGPHRFVVGDMKNPGNPNEVPVQGPQVRHQDLDAYTTKSAAFDELLAIIGAARGR